MKSGLFFLAANLAAGAFNYLFQVIAAQRLSPADYARLNGWFADLALFFVLSGLLQYYSNFAPARRGALRAGIVAINVAGLAIAAMWLGMPGPLGPFHTTMIVLNSCMTGWLLGQAQIRLRFVTLALVSLGVGVCRVTLVQVPGLAGGEFEKFTFVSLVVFVVSIWILSGSLWTAEDTKGNQRQGGERWRSAAILSIATAIIPQFDMFLMSHTQAESDFVLFTYASLFGRAVFAVMSIFAQWLLPNQLRGKDLRPKFESWMPVLGVFTLSGVVAALSPFVGEHLLRLKGLPGIDLVFLASCEISLLALIFVVVQSACATGRVGFAVFVLGVLGVEASCQLLVKMQMNSFLIWALVTQTALVLVFTPKVMNR